MALSETILFVSTITIFSLICCNGASISIPYANDLYPVSPSEVLEVKPYNYLRSRNLKYLKSDEILNDEDKVIYVKLVKVNYRPKHNQALNEFDIPAKESTAKDIFYVKALTNGQFSDQRLKVFYIPEFYAINVYKKNEI